MEKSSEFEEYQENDNLPPIKITIHPGMIKMLNDYLKSCRS